jgi:hypothetical protein
MHVTGFTWSVSDSIINWSVSVSIFVFRFVSWITVTISIPNYRYVSLSVSKFRSLERGGVSEVSQAQVDR